MTRHDVVVIGGGQAGLAVSRELGRRGVDHSVLERARVGSSWATLWENFRLNTPNWSIDLPGMPYGGDDPDGFMSRGEIVAHLERYVAAQRHAAAHRDRRAGVRFVAEAGGGPSAQNDRGPDDGAGGRGLHRCLPAILPASRRRRASSRPDHPGPALLPGPPTASPTGSCWWWAADSRAVRSRRNCATPERGRGGVRPSATSTAQGRRPRPDVVGRRDRLPRRHDRLPPRARSQVHGERHRKAGANGGHDLDAQVLRAKGAVLLGRFMGCDGGRVRFADDLAESVAWADERYLEFREDVVALCVDRGLDVPDLPDPEPFHADPPETFDVRALGGVIFTGGFRPDYGWSRRARRRRRVEVPGAARRRQRRGARSVLRGGALPAVAQVLAALRHRR